MNSNFTTIQEARHWASVFLDKHKRETRVADLLLEHFLNMSFAQLLAYERDTFPESKRDVFVEGVRIHAETGMPVQHITGEANFYGRDFSVNSKVLVPRSETEELVEGILRWVAQFDGDKPKIVDIGTGSGIIAITLSLELTKADICASDISLEALQIASHNAQKFGADIQFVQGDFYDPFKEEPVDIVVSNPPYIAHVEKDSMDDTVVDFDPSLALFADQEGLAAYHTIVKQIKESEHYPSLIAFEIGHLQGNAVKKIIKDNLPDYTVEVRKDMNTKDRMVFASRISG
ncbi:peptide chain release factor N(5)-glutamine methyltransferase [Halobacillus sp. K22]|uniref:peptide chain release factor N(5)-glutamine methyltransferase n=1 Tax=Halobacillus sp. K22 TaxID=3457431 RepID=UPI003FCEE2B8